MTANARDLSTLQPHPFANLFPLMSEADRAELRASYLVRGYDPAEPIILYNGAILDGRNRFNVARELNAGRPVTSVTAGQVVNLAVTGTAGIVTSWKDDGKLVAVRFDGASESTWVSIDNLYRLPDPPEIIIPTFSDFEGSADEALALVLGRNLARRHLTTSQRAMVAATLVNSRKGGQTKAELAGAVLSQYAAASRLGVSERSVRAAVKLLAEQPDDAAKVAAGETSLADAAKKKKEDSDEWYTPPEICERVRAALGGKIDLDPFSCAIAQRHVRAKTYFTKKQDGMTKVWGRRGVEFTLFLNPKYSDPGPAIARALAAVLRLGLVTDAVFIVNNDTDTDWCQMLLQSCSAIVYPRGRVSFLRPDGSRGSQNRQGQIIFHAGKHPQRFLDAFASLRGSHGMLVGRDGTRGKAAIR